MHVIKKEKTEKRLEEFLFTYKQLQAKQIVADQSYNRPVEMKRVEKIIANFDSNLVNPIKVSFRDGKYWIFDGNHTLRALVERSGNNGETFVDCKVYSGMTLKDEARMFALQNGISKNVANKHKLRALNVADDSEVVRFKAATDEAGAKCTFKATGSPYHIKCYDTAFTIFEKYGQDHYKNIISIIIKAWDGHPDSLRKEIICGLDILLRQFRDSIDKDRLIDKLSNENPKTIIVNGKGDHVFSGNKKYAIQIGKIYNKHMSKQNQLTLGELA